MPFYRIGPNDIVIRSFGITSLERTLILQICSRSSLAYCPLRYEMLCQFFPALPSLPEQTNVRSSLHPDASYRYTRFFRAKHCVWNGRINQANFARPNALKRQQLTVKNDIFHICDTLPDHHWTFQDHPRDGTPQLFESNRIVTFY